MPLPFAGAVTDAFVMQKATWLVLGDPGHGRTSLNSLASAIQAGALKPKVLSLKTVLFEGAKRGEELTAEGGIFAASVTSLRAAGLIVTGCENDATLGGAELVERMMAAAPDDPTAAANLAMISQQALDTRVPLANEAWAKAAKTAAGKAIICCGTSHVPKYTRPGATQEAGLKNRLGSQCMGYALAAPNDPNIPDTYFPEWNGTGPKLFGGVPVISAYP